jgi:hypothetical protein
MTIPAAETKSIGLLADAQLSWFLHHGLDSFIVTGQILLVYQDFATLTVSLDEKPLVRLQGLCKNTCQP